MSTEMGKNRKQSDSNDFDSILDQCMIEPNTCQEDAVVYDDLQEGELVFAVQLEEAYHFRNLFDYIKQANTHNANLIFTKDSISYLRASGVETILNKFTINTVDIPYHFNSVYENAVIGINVGEFARTTKNIGKKDAFKMFMIRGHDSKLFYEIITTTNTGMLTQSTGSIQAITVEEPIITFPTDFEGPPIQSIPINIFCHNCSVLTNFRCKTFNICAFENGMKLEGVDSYGEIQTVQRFYPSKMQVVENKADGTIGVDINKNAANSNIGTLLQTIRVPIQVIKWISKLNNVSPHGGRILVHAGEGKPIKLSGSIGFYGSFEIFIKNENTLK